MRLEVSCPAKGGQNGQHFASPQAPNTRRGPSERIPGPGAGSPRLPVNSFGNRRTPAAGNSSRPPAPMLPTDPPQRTKRERLRGRHGPRRPGSGYGGFLLGFERDLAAAWICESFAPLARTTPTRAIRLARAGVKEKPPDLWRVFWLPESNPLRNTLRAASVHRVSILTPRPEQGNLQTGSPSRAAADAIVPASIVFFSLGNSASGFRWGGWRGILAPVLRECGREVVRHMRSANEPTMRPTAKRGSNRENLFGYVCCRWAIPASSGHLPDMMGLL